MKAFINFIQDLRKMSSLVQAWLMILGISNMMIPIVLFRHMEAKIMLLTTITGFMIGVLLHKRKGMTRILGFMHVPWLVAIFFLIKGIVSSGAFDLYNLWMTVALILTSFSLILDIRDVVKYFSGHKESII
jgi:hypothetical protein